MFFERPLPEDDSHALPPSFINSQQFPLDLWRKIVQQSVNRRMHVQSGSDQEQQRLSRAEFAEGKVSEALELAASVVPGHARPVIQTLHGQVNVFVGLEFDDGEPPCTGDR